MTCFENITGGDGAGVGGCFMCACEIWVWFVSSRPRIYHEKGCLRKLLVQGEWEEMQNSLLQLQSGSDIANPSWAQMTSGLKHPSLWTHRPVSKKNMIAFVSQWVSGCFVNVEVLKQELTNTMYLILESYSRLLLQELYNLQYVHHTSYLNTFSTFGNTFGLRVWNKK